MKNSIKTMLALMAGTIAFTACSNEDEFENINEQAPLLKHMTFTANQEGQDGITRAEIDGVSIKWTDGDKISIFDGVVADEHFDHTFTLTEGIGKTSGTFDGEAVETTTYYAIYPCVSSTFYAGRGAADIEYVSETINRQMKEQSIPWTDGMVKDLWESWQQFVTGNMDFYKQNPEYVIDYYMTNFMPLSTVDGVSVTDLLNADQMALFKALITGEVIDRTFKDGVQQDGSKFTAITLPAEQTATEGSADPKAMLMIGTSDDTNNIQFKNICAYVKVTPTFDCSAILLRSNGSENLAGTVTVDYNGGEPTTTVTANGTNKIFLAGDIKANKSYYIAVRPEALSSGFTIEFLTADNSNYYARTSSKDLGLARNKVVNLGTFDTTSSWTINTPTTGDDGNGHTWYLVTPTLKLASADAGRDAYTAASNLWGEDWVIPSKEDVQPIVDEKASSFKSTATAKYATIKGTGILRNLSYTITFSYSTPIVWLSTQNGSQQQTLSLNNNIFSVAGPTTKMTSILYKYTK